MHTQRARNDIVPIGGGVTPEQKQSWDRVRRRLKTEVGEAVFNAWFGLIEFDALCAGAAHLSVATRFLKSWIQSHYTDRILAALQSEMPETTALLVSRRSSGELDIPSLSCTDPGRNASDRTAFSGVAAPSWRAAKECCWVSANPRWPWVDWAEAGAGKFGRDDERTLTRSAVVSGISDCKAARMRSV